MKIDISAEIFSTQVLEATILELRKRETEKELEERLAGKEGQCVLLVESKLQESPMKFYAYPHRSNMLPPPSYQKLQVHLSLGIISGDTLIMDRIQGCFLLPTKQFLYYVPRTGFSPIIRTCDLPIVEIYTVRDFITQSKKEFHYDGRKHFEMEVLIGDEEVKKWFSQEKKTYLFEKMAELLSRPLESEQGSSPYLALSWRM